MGSAFGAQSGATNGEGALCALTVGGPVFRPESGPCFGAAIWWPTLKLCMVNGPGAWMLDPYYVSSIPRVTCPIRMIRNKCTPTMLSIMTSISKFIW
jgi:hypothetical protein